MQDDRHRHQGTERWNHNIHYHQVVLKAIPAGARRVLDVGCGEGMLARALRQIVPEVVAIDLDRPSIEAARACEASSGIEYVLDDILTHPFEAASFDVVVSVAMLHHLDATTALLRLRDLLRPGGTLAIVGLARSRFPFDLPLDLAAAVASCGYRRTRQHWDHPSPTVWPPPETYAGVRRLAGQVLPGVRYRRHLLWRYSLVWVKPDR